MKKFFLGLEDELFVIEETVDGHTSASHLKGVQPTRLAVDPQNEERIYCATYGNGLWKSEDGGASWVAVGKSNVYHEPLTGKGIQSAYITSVAVHPNNGIVYAGTEPSGLYYSMDNGENWTEFTGIQTLPSKRNWQFPPRPHTSHVRWITPSFLDENHLNVSIEFGAFISTKNHGESWQDRPFNSPLDTHTLLTHPQAPGRLYAACGDGLHTTGHGYAESEDEGRTWQYISEGLERHPYLYNMVLHPYDPNDRIVSASRSAAQAHHTGLYSTIYRKQGSGFWQEISQGLPCEGSFSHTLAADPSETGVFYAMNNQGLYRLSADGIAWQKLETDWQEKFRSQHPTCLLVKEC